LKIDKKTEKLRKIKRPAQKNWTPLGKCSPLAELKRYGMIWDHPRKCYENLGYTFFSFF